MVTIFPVMVATAVFELVYVIAPALLDEGATNANGAFPNVFVGTVKPVIVGASFPTVSVAEDVPNK
jgi:hypothetical protein